MNASQPFQIKIPVEAVTARELEILGLIETGLSNREIADALTISVNTVKRHASNIYGKLGVGSRTRAVNHAKRLNLL